MESRCRFRILPAPMLWLLGAVALCAQLAGAAKFCPDSKVCYTTKAVTITKNGATTNGIEIQITTSIPGWVGFGIGSSMADADIVIVEPQAQPGVVAVKDTRSTARQAPVPDAQQDWSSVQTVQGQYVIQRAVNTGDTNDKVFLKGKQNYIWAYGSDDSKVVSYHGSTRGVVQMDVFDAAGSGDADKSAAAMVYSHGILMFFAWGVFSYAGIWAAAFGKSMLGEKWFPIHKGFLFLGTGLVSTVAFIIITILVKGLTFSTIHNVIGFIILVVMVAQIILGVVIDKLYNPDRTGVPWWDKTHWWTGRCLAVLSAVNIFLGLWLVSAGAVLFVLFGIWLALVAAGFGFSRYRSPYHHGKGQGNMSTTTEALTEMSNMSGAATAKS